MEVIEIRIKRNRTQMGNTVWEMLEKWSKMEGRTIPGSIEYLIKNSPIFKEFCVIAADPKYGEKFP